MPTLIYTLLQGILNRRHDNFFKKMPKVKQGKALQGSKKLTARIEAARDSAEYASMNSSLLYICSSLLEMPSLLSSPFGCPSVFPISASYSRSLYQANATHVVSMGGVGCNECRADKIDK